MSKYILTSLISLLLGALLMRSCQPNKVERVIINKTITDTLIKQVKKYIKDYGKKENFDYIFTTSDDAPTVIHAKENYDLTKILLKKLNDEYKTTKEKK